MKYLRYITFTLAGIIVFDVSYVAIVGYPGGSIFIDFAELSIFLILIAIGLLLSIRTAWKSRKLLPLLFTLVFLLAPVTKMVLFNIHWNVWEYFLEKSITETANSIKTKKIQFQNNSTNEKFLVIAEHGFLNAGKSQYSGCDVEVTLNDTTSLCFKLKSSSCYKFNFGEKNE
ncbi:MAG: hypothetical protein KAR38_17780 [Calditrichia bacterium]|nr:hypothetical protein [Calditrichia bacterium]